MSDYYFKDNEFVIENYDKQKTFSSFLPGIAGKRGIPLWAFYVNRGQGIASFGVENKDRHILEFSPAVKAYQLAGTDGFRTFVKIDGTVHEIFGENKMNVKRIMRIKRSEFSVEEENFDLKLTFKMTYFGLPNENFASLVRIVEVTNNADKDVSFELVDGLSQLLPTGVSQASMKFLTNLTRSWMDVYHLDKNVGFYRMRSSSSDTAEIVEVRDGNFYVSSHNGALIKPIADQRLVFGFDTSKRVARLFEETSVQDLLAMEQATVNKIPVGFSALEIVLKAHESTRMNTLIGHVYSDTHLLDIASTITQDAYIDEKREDAQNILDDLLKDVEMTSNLPIFDDYMKQNYLDNLMRGGYPMVLKNNEENLVYHIYSRRHGDLERDYNFFSIAPEFYSQGNGSFRDVCQNRRSDVLLNPEVGDFNLKMFGSFIQSDGYNPLSIDGSTFEIKDASKVKEITKKLFNSNKEMLQLLNGTFTPGSIINTMYRNNVVSTLTDDEIFNTIFPFATQKFEAHFAEGYWIDHWTYILDLIENFEAVYPDKIMSTLFDEHTYKYFDSPIYVVPRDEKTCVTKDGKVRRYGSLLHPDKEKMNTLNMDPNKAAWLLDSKDEIVYGSLFEKLTVLAVNKIANLDPSGIGIEMEADKPGWNDAMNGLPGLFGSGVSETIELKRVVGYLLNHFERQTEMHFPLEFVTFMEEVHVIIESEINDYNFWDKVNTVKETYRAAIRFGTEKLVKVDSVMVQNVLHAIDQKVDIAIQKAHRLGKGIYPTYLVHEVTSFEQIYDDNGPKIGNYGLPVAKALEFKVRALPLYLEAPARALKIMKNDAAKKQMFQHIKSSNMYDHELKFYKTSEFLDDESNEIGRGRSFTKGWQERESNFLHMTYKYLVGLLKGGLYEEFFEEIKTNLTIFMDPEVYGRSTLENSSFIASSINPDPFVRGQGFVARLSGSTAEMLSMWFIMMFGAHPFVTINSVLTLQLKPVLTKEFFKDKEVSVTFLGKVKVTYINESNIDTFDPSFAITKYEVDHKVVTEITGALAEKVRSGSVTEIKVYF